MTMGATYTNDAPLPRSFECAMCGSDVVVTEKLKPCPFCGGNAHVMPSSFVFGEEREWIVLCTKCYAKTLGFRSESTAIAAWNRYANEKEGR